MGSLWDIHDYRRFFFLFSTSLQLQHLLPLFSFLAHFSFPFLQSLLSERTVPQTFLVLKRTFILLSNWSFPSNTKGGRASSTPKCYPRSVLVLAGQDLGLQKAPLIRHGKYERLASWCSTKRTGSQKQESVTSYLYGPDLSPSICVAVD